MFALELWADVLSHKDSFTFACLGAHVFALKQKSFSSAFERGPEEIQTILMYTFLTHSNSPVEEHAIVVSMPSSFVTVQHFFSTSLTS